MLNYRSADTLFRRASGSVACVSVLALAAIVLFLLAQALPIFKDVPIWDFLFTTDWYPTDEPPVFGLGAMIVGSFAAAVLTAVIGSAARRADRRGPALVRYRLGPPAFSSLLSS